MRRWDWFGLVLALPLVGFGASCVTINESPDGTGPGSTGEGGGVGGSTSTGEGGGAGGSTSTGSVTCGNAQIDAGEQCDDGNATSCDGCESCEKRHWLEVPAGAYVRSPEAKNALPPVDSDACYEVWGKTNGSLNDAIYFASTSAGTQTNVILRCLFGEAVMAVQAGTVIEIKSGASCADNQWHHVAGCREVDGDNVSLSLYFDGELAGSGSGTTAQIAPPTDVLVGGVNYGQDGLAGAIDEVRVSNLVRYRENFVPARRFEPDANTTLLWHFDEGAGTVVADSSGNDFSGTVVGGSFSPDTGYLPAFCD
jgi:cysteine-rich repeat protein